MTTLYNEIDRFCCDWLSNMMDAGLISPGKIDDRSICDLRPEDLEGFERVHFFAGIAGWEFALQLAGWPDERPVWTGSCPCQDFSIVGQQARFNGARDLWPAWRRLIEQRRPFIVFGEQVDNAAEWIDRTAADFEYIDYAFGSHIIPALALGAQHERSRLLFVADSHSSRWSDFARVATDAWTSTVVRRSSRMVHSEAFEQIQWPLKPDQSWIIDGVPADRHIVGALGNAIVPQVVAQFIGAYLDCEGV